MLLHAKMVSFMNAGRVLYAWTLLTNHGVRCLVSLNSLTAELIFCHSEHKHASAPAHTENKPPLINHTHENLKSTHSFHLFEMY